jgi:hypothetical protein
MVHSFKACLALRMNCIGHSRQFDSLAACAAMLRMPLKPWIRLPAVSPALEIYLLLVTYARFWHEQLETAPLVIIRLAALRPFELRHH